MESVGVRPYAFFFSILLIPMASTKFVQDLQSPTFNAPKNAKALNYLKKAQLVELILNYQAQELNAKAQLSIKQQDVKALIKGIDQTNQDFISPKAYLSDINKRSARHQQEVNAIIRDTKNAFKTVKRIISLPSFI